MYFVGGVVLVVSGEGKEALRGLFFLAESSLKNPDQCRGLGQNQAQIIVIA